MIQRSNRDDIFLDKIYKNIGLNNPFKKIDTILRIYSVMGILMAVFGGVYFALVTLDIELTQQQQMALLVAGTGVFISVFSRILLTIRKERYYEYRNMERELFSENYAVDKWSEFENTARSLLKKNNDVGADLSVRDIIRKLYEKGIINDIDSKNLDDALKIRNAIVHNNVNINKNTLRIMESKIDAIIQKISTAI